MKYWLDTEFIEDGRTIDLISIGIVAEDGREYYAIDYYCDLSRANDWVREHVISLLPKKPLSTPKYLEFVTAGNVDSIKEYDYKQDPAYLEGWRSRGSIATEIINFCNPKVFGKPEFWAYYADYDWVAFCQLFGTMMDLPKGFPMYCRDLKQWCDDLGDLKLPEQGEGEHNALADARWNRRAWKYLDDYERSISMGQLPPDPTSVLFQ